MQQKLLKFLKQYHKSQHRAIPSRSLEAKFHVTGSTIRRNVLALRKQGEPICSDMSGYYYAASPVELQATINSFHRRVKSSSQAKRALTSALESMPENGQTTLYTERGEP